jgi:CRISPR-associated protein Csm1
MNPEEKTILLSALFHDIGKFGQCCSHPMDYSHTKIGVELLESMRKEILPLLDYSELYFKELCDLVANHHNPDSVLYHADKISAGMGIDKELETEKSLSGNLLLLSSVFSSVRLASKKEVSSHFYNQIPRDKKSDESLSPVGKDVSKIIRYDEKTFARFQEDLKTILSSTALTIDFPSVFSLILNLFENYLWCVPDYTDGSIGDISLYNHLRDTAGFAHAIQKTKEENQANKELILVVGDLPGIQKYIFNVLNKKPAKILRGRSIFVQVITKVFAGIFLSNFKLTEASMIMNAGGKFYILAPGTEGFEEVYKKTIEEIDNLLSANFFYELNFASGYAKFDYTLLAKGKTALGDVITKAGFNLRNGRFRMFEHEFFSDFKESKFVLEADYISPAEGEDGTDSVKCSVTDKPIRKGRKQTIKDEDDSYRVDLQVQNEFNIGDIVPKKPVVCSIKKHGLNFILDKAVPLNDFNTDDSAYKVIINPSIEEIVKQLQTKTTDEIFRLFNTTSYIGVANYASKSEKTGGHRSIMSFEEMVETCEGAHLLTLIKGDVDNLGLIMSAGFDQANPVSRTTTMSSHLKYFFSTNLNNLLDQKCGSDDQRAYTVFAGGDDIFLITTQSYSLDLLKEINDKFNQFVCHNPEIHISYSLTNFKHSTPIMLVAGFAEESQSKIKKVFKNPELPKSINESSFLTSNDKSGVMIFGTAVKGDKLGEFIDWSNRLARWTELSSKPPISKGAVRHIFEISKMMNDYYEKKNTAALIWHPLLTYYIKRNLNTAYRFEDVSEQAHFQRFLSQILKIEKEDEFDLKTILHPLMNSVILKTRN